MGSRVVEGVSACDLDCFDSTVVVPRVLVLDTLASYIRRDANKAERFLATPLLWHTVVQ